MTTRHGRLTQLRRALETAISEPTTANLATAGDAYQAVAFSTDEDDDEDATARRNDVVEMMAIRPLGRRLAQKLGPAAPAWLHDLSDERDDA